MLYQPGCQVGPIMDYIKNSGHPACEISSGIRQEVFHRVSYIAPYWARTTIPQFMEPFFQNLIIEGTMFVAGIQTIATTIEEALAKKEFDPQHIVNILKEKTDIIYPNVRGGKLKIRKYPVELILPQIGPESDKHQIWLDKMHINAHSLRLNTFVNSGIECVECGVRGTHFWLEHAAGKNKINAARKAGSKFIAADQPHLALYAIDAFGNEVLMTCDHIRPLSKGGTNALSNTQTMCERCNHAKGATYEEQG